MVGSLSLAIGVVISAILVVDKLKGQAIANRPLLLLGVLLVALGVQLMGLGLVREITVHLRAPHRRAYRMRERCETRRRHPRHRRPVRPRRPAVSHSVNRLRSLRCSRQGRHRGGQAVAFLSARSWGLRSENPPAGTAPILSGPGHAARRSHRPRVPQCAGHASISSRSTRAGCRAAELPDLPDLALPGIQDIRPARLLVEKVICDGLMLVECIRLVRRNRYDLIHAVEESAFIAAVIQALPGFPTSTTWTPRSSSR